LLHDLRCTSQAIHEFGDSAKGTKLENP
jgi:hypothetical protein